MTFNAADMRLRCQRCGATMNTALSVDPGAGTVTTTHHCPGCGLVLIPEQPGAFWSAGPRPYPSDDEWHDAIRTHIRRTRSPMPVEAWDETGRRLEAVLLPAGTPCGW